LLAAAAAGAQMQLLDADEPLPWRPTYLSDAAKLRIRRITFASLAF